MRVLPALALLAGLATTACNDDNQPPNVVGAPPGEVAAMQNGALLLAFVGNQKNTTCNDPSDNAVVGQQVYSSTNITNRTPPPSIVLLDEQQACLVLVSTMNAYGPLAGNNLGYVAGIQITSGTSGAVSFAAPSASKATVVSSFAYPVSAVTAPLANGNFFVGTATNGHIDMCNIGAGSSQPCPNVFIPTASTVNALALDPVNKLLWAGYDNGSIYKCPPSGSGSCALFATAASSITSLAIDPNSGDLAASVYNGGILYYSNAGQQSSPASITLPSGNTASNSQIYTEVDFASGQLFVLYPDGTLVVWPKAPTSASTPSNVGSFSNPGDSQKLGKTQSGMGSDGTSIYVTGANGTIVMCTVQGPCNTIGQALGGFSSFWWLAIAAMDPFVLAPN